MEFRQYHPAGNNRASALNNQAIPEIRKKNFKGAEVFLAEALALYEQSAEPDQEGQAVCLTNLGGLYYEIQYLPKAEAAYLQAIQIYERLMAQEPDRYRASLSQLLVGLGYVYATTGRFRQSESILLRAADIQEQAGTHMALAALYDAMGNLEEAEKQLDQALNTGDPQQPKIYQRLGDLYVRQGNLQAARQAYGTTVNICESPIADNPEHAEEFQGVLARTLAADASLYLQENDMPSAEILLAKAAELYEGLVRTDPERYDPGFAAVLNLQDAVRTGDGEHDAQGGTPVLERMLRLTVLASKFNTIDGPAKAEVLLNLAAVYARRRQFAGAQQSYISALEMLGWLENINPGTYRSSMAGLLHSLGSLCRDFGNLREAESFFNRSVAISNKLVQEYPAVYEPALARTYRSLAKLYLTMEDRGRAVIAFNSAASVFERLSAQNPSLYEPELAEIYQETAAVLFRRGHMNDASEVLVKAIPVLERLSEHNPVSYETLLIHALLNLAMVFESESDPRQAELQWKKALLLRRRFGNESEDAFDSATAKILRNMGRFYMRSGRWEEAAEAAGSSVCMYAALERSRPEVYSAKKQELLAMLDKIYAGKAEELSIQDLDRQLRIYMQLDSLQPGAYAPKIAEILTGLASEYADAERLQEALEARLQAHEIYGRLPEYRFALVESLFWLAILYEQKSDFAAADETYRNCLETYERTNDSSPAVSMKYANALMYYGKYLARQGRADAAQEYTGRSIRIAQSVS